MRTLQKLLLGLTLSSIIAGCYVEHHPYYAHRTCAAGWRWDGYRCHYHYW